ncbi:AraC family transcriptional regulator [Paenibacillus sp. WQ 127069]|uniref:AraC family transcriptional regulator n=1 Tax=Paenibacillus baimaensis TaxID=2982185 RepID=A0ABT2UN64_9BACL|nr:AraC family transcriptional regulator [Paenibacillus sp. WQ 127069]MCU6796090.1 AraC family transcriptional regulator [Paenibacillus sp. WQ 127069]
MSTLLDIKEKSRSLFNKLLFSFLVIILLFTTFNFVSYAFFRNNLYDEIIRYNTLNLNHTVDNYENHLHLLQTTLLSELFSTSAIALESSRDQPSYSTVVDLNNELRVMMGNEPLFLDNVIVQFQNLKIAVDKNGSHQSADLFDKYYESQLYTKEFWRAEALKPFSFQLYPAAEFSQKKVFDPSPGQQQLLPIMVKKSGSSNTTILAFLDASKALKKFHQSINSNFLILDSSGKVIYNVGDTSLLDNLPDFSKSDSLFIKHEKNLYFYKASPESGLIYVNIVPEQSISQQTTQMNVILISLLVIAIIISVGTSIFFSMKFNNPLKRIVQSVTELNASAPPTFQIREFNIISQRLAQLAQSDRNAKADLSHKDSLLQYYSFINKIKNIQTHSDVPQEEKPDMLEKPFVMTAFQLTYKEDFEGVTEFGKDKASYYVKEFIQMTMLKEYENSLTFQMEQDMILTLIFADPVLDERIQQTLLHIKQVLDLDNQYIFLTIAVSDVYPESANFTAAYEQSLERLQKRKLNEETQIIAPSTTAETPIHHWGFTSLEDQDFMVHLHAGNAAQTITLVHRALDRMQKNEATAHACIDFAQEIVSKVNKTLITLQLDMQPAADSPSPGEQIRSCYTHEQFKEFLSGYLSLSAELIQKKKEGYDPITKFMTEYMESHIGEDLSLDILADKLKVSAAYLSAYFKDKTGINFIDYLNDLRIRKAKEMLLGSDAKIQDIAVSVGYQSVNSFIRMFKRSTGMSPGEFRKSSLTGS